MTLSTLGAAGGGAAVSPALASAAVALGTGGPVVAGVSALAGATMPSANWGRVLLAAAVGVGLVGGAAAWPRSVPADDPPPAPAATKPKPKPADPGKLLIWDTDKHLLLDPAGKVLAERKFQPPERYLLSPPVLSPDGRTVAFKAEGPSEKVGESWQARWRLLVYPTAGGEGRRLPTHPWVEFPFWLPNGHLAASEPATPEGGENDGFTTFALNPTTSERTRLDLPQWFQPQSVARDGRTFVGVRVDVDHRKGFLSRVTLGGVADDLVPVEATGTAARLSPDGGQVLFKLVDPATKSVPGGRSRTRLYLFDVASRTQTRLPGVPDGVELLGHCWSPDGRRLAYVWRAGVESSLTLADADGRNPQVIRSARGVNDSEVTLLGVDWR